MYHAPVPLRVRRCGASRPAKAERGRIWEIGVGRLEESAVRPRDDHRPRGRPPSCQERTMKRSDVLEQVILDACRAFHERRAETPDVALAKNYPPKLILARMQ